MTKRKAKGAQVSQGVLLQGGGGVCILWPLWSAAKKLQLIQNRASKQHNTNSSVRHNIAKSTLNKW